MIKKKCVLRARKGCFIEIFGHSNHEIILLAIWLRLLDQVVISGKQFQGEDIESNPRPTYNIQKIVQGSFH